jgi:hypothetical protein
MRGGAATGQGREFANDILSLKNCALYERMMAQVTISTSRLDRLAMGLSGLCLVHCVATAILLGLLASAGGLLGKPIVHEVGLSLAMIIGAVALGRGIREHGFVLPAAVGALGLAVMGYALTLPEGGHEPLFTVAGVMILALGHRLNVMATVHNF